MELSLFQWIGLGLIIALILIPIVRWFWKRFDRPSDKAIALEKQIAEEAAESRMWKSIEAQVEEERAKVMQIEMKRKENQERAGKSLSDSESENAWSALGIDVPIQPVEKEEPPEIKIDDQISNSEESNELEKNTLEPDWELISKLANLDEPTADVPEAPDLEMFESEIESKEIQQNDENPSANIVEEIQEEVEEESTVEYKFVSTQIDNSDWSVGW